MIDYRRACFKAVLAFVCSAILVERPVIIEDVDRLKTMTLADLKVRRVMSGRDFQSACAELHVHSFVADYGN